MVVNANLARVLGAHETPYFKRWACGHSIFDFSTT